MSFDLNKCRSKDELEAFALEKFGVDLDKRKKLDELKDEVRALIAASPNAVSPNAVSSNAVSSKAKEAATNPHEAPEAELIEAVIPDFVLNPTTKVVFLNHSGLSKKVAAGKLIPCDKNGRLV